MRNKKGISLITLAITIVVMIILTSIVILSLTNTGLIKDSKEAKYKSDLKAFDEEIREKMATIYLEDKTAMYRIITDPEEISKYSEGLVKSEYIKYSYISEGELTLRSKMLTEQQINWAKEAKIKIDHEEFIFTEEKVQIKLSENGWTRGPISAELSYSSIPYGYELQYKIDQGKWTSRTNITNITRNCTISARLYNKNNYNEMGLNNKDVTKIDRIIPKIVEIKESQKWASNSVGIELIVSGATDEGSGLHELAYSFDDGVTWQESNSKTFYSNLSGIIIRVRDKVGNEYVHPSINISKIDTTPPTIESVTGNSTDWTKDDITLTINGAKDSESGLHESPYSFDNGVTWQTSNSKIYTQNESNIIIKVRDAVGNEYIHPSIDIIYIDKEAPSKPTEISVIPGINTLQVKAYGSVDDKSGVAGYQYRLGENGEWTDTYAEGVVHIFSGIASSTNVVIYARAVDNVGNVSGQEDLISKNVSTDEISGKVSITLEYIDGVARYNDWTKNLNIRFNHDSIPDGYKIKYTLSSIKTETITNIVENNYIIPLDYNCTISAVLYNEALQDEATSTLGIKDITVIDNIAPSKPVGIGSETTTNTIKVSAYGSTENESGLAGYQYSIDGVNWTSDIYPTGYTYTDIKSSTTISTIYSRAVDNLGNISSMSSPINASTDEITGKIAITLEYISGIAKYNDWTKKINVRFYHASIPDGYNLVYKLSTGSPTTFTTITNNSVIELDYNCTVTAMLYNPSLKEEVSNTIATKDITIIDNMGPSIPTTLTLTTQGVDTLTVSASGSSDAGCGFNRYQYSMQSNTGFTVNNKFTGLEAGKTYTIYTRAVDNLSNVSKVYSTNYTTLNQYTISYNKNTTDTVTNMPTSQTKVENSTLTLSSLTPTRIGYTFKGWATSASGNVVYGVTGKYTSNSKATLYAVWQPITYTVTYNANGGTGTMSNSSHTYDVAKNLNNNTFSRYAYTFGGWSTSSSGSVEYANSASVKNLSNKDGEIVQLYAIWYPTKVSFVVENDFYISYDYFGRSTSTSIITKSDFGDHSYPTIDYLEVTLPANYTIVFSPYSGNLDYIFNNKKSMYGALSTHTSEGIGKDDVIESKSYTTTTGGTYYITGVYDYTNTSDLYACFSISVKDPNGNLCNVSVSAK